MTEAPPPKKKKKKKKKRKGPFKIYREGGWLLYFWHGMRFGVWLRLLARGRFDVTLNCMPNILTVTLFTPLNTVLYFISEALYRFRVGRHPIDPPPLFVLGHWRSGTTLLHDLLSADPAHGYPTTYQCFFPSHFLLTGGAVRRWFNVFLPKRRPMDNVTVGVDRPQEDEFALMNLGLGSPTITMAWPRHGPQDMAYLTLSDLDAETRKRWENGFLWFLRRLSFRQRKRLVLKSPAHTARIDTLVKLCPNARFVHISRNPLSVVPSSMKLWKALNSVQGLHNPAQDDPWLEEFVFDMFGQVFSSYEAQHGQIPEGHLTEISFEDLVADPKAVLRQIYGDLDLGPFERAEPGVDSYLASARDYQANIHSLPDDTRVKIEDRCAPYMKRFGYLDPVQTAAPSKK